MTVYKLSTKQTTFGADQTALAAWPRLYSFMTTKGTDTRRRFLGTIIFLKLIPSIYFMINRCYKLSAQYLPLCNICNLLGRCDILFWQNWTTCIKWPSSWENLFCICENKCAGIGRFQAIKTDVLLIFSFITGDKTEFLSPMMFSNEYITEIWLSEFYLINFLLLSIKFNTNV